MNLPAQKYVSVWGRTTLAVSVAIALAACSSSQTTEEGEQATDEVPLADAGTDPVPLAGAEDPNGAAPADPNAVAAAAPADGADPYAGTTTDPYAAAPEAAPEPTASAGTEFAGSRATENYSFKSGDTLMRVAFEVYGDFYQWRKIYEANKGVISDPNHIPEGTALKLERPATAVQISRNGDPYRIKSGETLGTISNRVYGTQSRWKEIWKNNPELIKDPNKIYAGFTLYYVAGGDSQMMGSTTSADAPKERQPASTATEGGAATSVTPAAPASANPSVLSE